MSTWGIVNVNVWQAHGAILRDQQILLEGGTVAGIGADAATDAEGIVDAAGTTAYPGLFAAFTTLGITGRPGQQDDAIEAGPLWPELDTFNALNSNDETIAVSRMEGVTGALTAGGYTSIFGGAAAAIHLADDLRGSCILPRAMQVVNLEYESAAPSALNYMSNVSATGPTTPGGVYAFVHQALTSAGTEGDTARDRALREIIDREIRVLFMTNDQVGIRQAIELTRKFGLDAVVHAKADIVPFAAELADAQISVIWDGTSAPPRAGEAFDRNYVAAARLAAAGVDFALGVPNWGPWRDTGSRPASHMVRTIPQCAAQSVAYGLDEEQALRSITVDAARIVLGRPHGDLQIGSCGDLALWNGSPLQLSSRVSEVFIHGERVSRESFQTLLRDGRG